MLPLPLGQALLEQMAALEGIAEGDEEEEEEDDEVNRAALLPQNMHT